MLGELRLIDGVPFRFDITGVATCLNETRYLLIVDDLVNRSNGKRIDVNRLTIGRNRLREWKSDRSRHARAVLRIRQILSPNLITDARHILSEAFGNRLILARHFSGFFDRRREYLVQFLIFFGQGSGQFLHAILSKLRVALEHFSDFTRSGMGFCVLVFKCLAKFRFCHSH